MDILLGRTPVRGALDPSDEAQVIAVGLPWAEAETMARTLVHIALSELPR